MDSVFKGGNPSERLNPSFTQEQEEAGVPEELPSVVMGPPAFASPDPRTAGSAMLPLEEHPLSAELSEDYAADEIAAGNVTSLPTTMDAEAAGFGGGDPWAGFPEDEEEATKAQWQTVAKNYGLSTGGNKATLKKRIAEHEELLEGDASMKAQDWIDEVDAADNAEELASLKARYEASGSDFVTVQDALEKRDAEFAEDTEK